MLYRDVVDLCTQFGKAHCVCVLYEEHKATLNDELTQLPSKASYLYKVNIIVKEYTRVRKNSSRPGFQEKLDAFFEKSFSFPSVAARQPVRVRKTTPSASTVYKKVAEDIASELNKSKEDCKKVSAKLQNREVHQELRKVNVQNALLKKRLRSNRTTSKRYISKILHLEKSKQKLTVQAETDAISLRAAQQQIDALQTTLEEAVEARKEAVTENEWLREMVQTDMMTKNDNGHYTDELKECVFALLTHNVSTSQVSRVIEDVLKLAGLVARDLPCISTIQDWNIMRLLVSQQQLGEVLPQEQHLGLLSDETSKFGQKFEGFHASDPDGRVYVLGMRDIISKSGQDCLNTFKQILCDIDDVPHGSYEVARKILVKIFSTMSDRESTQIKFNKLLEEYRKDILSLTVENYYSMSEAQQLSLGKLLQKTTTRISAIT